MKTNNKKEIHLSKEKKLISRYVLLGVLMLLPCTLSAQADRNTLFFISDSHLDTQWNWDVRTTIGEYVYNTMTQNFPLLDKYPNFNFNFEGAIKYMWMKEYYSLEYSKLKSYISSGRWHVSGCSVDACDVMTTSAESIMRNWLYARDFYMQEFGVRGGYDVMLPDCFGFSYALPSLAYHCGMKGFHTAKLHWGAASFDQLPPWGIWQGVDGSEIYAVYKPYAYDTHEDYNKDMSSDAGIKSLTDDNYKKYGLATEIRYVGPRSDHGGGLKDDASSTGENTPYWLNYSASPANNAVRVCVASPDSIFNYLDKYKNDKYSVWNSELPMRTHGVGAYTSKTFLKYLNRKTELLADAAEKSSSLASWLGVEEYPSQAIKDSWVRMLWQQHHDGITGTSIPRAYVFSENEYLLANKTFANVLTNSVGSVSRLMNTQVGGTPVVVYNPLSFDRNDIVEGKMQMTSKPRPYGIQVFGPDGKEVLSQITGYNDATNELSFIFAAQVPSLGCAVYDVRTGVESALNSSMSLDSASCILANDNYQLQLNRQTGDVSSLRNVTSGRMLVTTCSQQLLQDNSTTWPAWEIQYKDDAASPIGTVNENVEISPVENGALRKCFKISRSKNGSRFVQYVRMNALDNRVDFVNKVDWESKATMLKANFNFMFGDDKATYDLSLGTIQRGNRSEDQYEVQGHQWADLTNPASTFGVSVLNDCKYGWDKPNNTSLRLTLIHTPGVDKNYTYQGLQDLGVNKFTYSLYPHNNDWNQETQKAAAELNQPLIAFVADKHEGALGKSISFLSLNTDKVAVKAVKKAEEGDELIVRVYEWTGNDQQGVKIHFPTKIASAREVNGLEEPLGDATFSDSTLTFNIGKYQPKTFAIRLDKSDDENVNSTSTTKVELDYNADVMSYNENRADASKNLVTLVYPAEQIEDNVTSGGVTFTMGSRADGKMNAVRCQGQKVKLSPTGNQNKLYILAMSTHMGGSTGTFKVGDNVCSFHVPYYTGYVGQLANAFNAGTRYTIEDVALVASHAHNCTTSKDVVYNYLYAYKFMLPVPKGTTEITLPSNGDIYVLAASLSDYQGDNVKPFTTVNAYLDYTDLDDGTDKTCGGYLVPNTISYSAQNGTAEGADLAADMDETTKWCVLPSQDKTPYIEYDFSEPQEVCKWSVLNAGCESTDWIASDFKLQALVNGTWKDIDVVNGNTDNFVQRGIEPIKASRFRLKVVKGQQDDNYTTRIYEFALYGKTDGSISGISALRQKRSSTTLKLYGCHPNPCLHSTTINCDVPGYVSSVDVEIYAADGQLVDKRTYPVSKAGKIFWNGSLPCGMYLYRISASVKGKVLYSSAKRLIVQQ